MDITMAARDGSRQVVADRVHAQAIVVGVVIEEHHADCEFAFGGRLLKQPLGRTGGRGRGCGGRRGGCGASGLSGVFENQDAVVVQLDFGCSPSWALVESVGIGIGWIPGTVEPVEVRLVVGNPFRSPAAEPQDGKTQDSS